jgi:hypothetical protein
LEDSNNKIMAHVDALLNVAQLAQAIKGNFDLNDSALKAFLIPGDGILGPSNLSQDKVRQVFENLNLENKYVQDDYTYTFFMEDLVYDKSSRIYQAKHKIPAIPAGDIIKKDGLSYRFAGNAKIDEVERLPEGDIKRQYLLIGYKEPIVTIHKDTILGPPRAGSTDDKQIGFYKKIDTSPRL